MKLAEGIVLIPFENVDWPVYHEGQLWNIIWRSEITGRINIELPDGSAQVQQMEPEDVKHMAIHRPVITMENAKKSVTSKVA